MSLSELLLLGVGVGSLLVGVDFTLSLLSTSLMPAMLSRSSSARRLVFRSFTVPLSVTSPSLTKTSTSLASI